MADATPSLPSPIPGGRARRGAPHERRVVLLGSTGSIGTQTLDVIEHLNRRADDPDAGPGAPRLRVVGLAAGRNTPLLLEQARRFGVRDLALAAADGPVRDGGVHLRAGPGGPEALVRETECDLVLGAMVGAAGLPATLAAVELGRDVALANKETLVAAGGLVVPAAARSGARLLPVDSEHCAAWQCLQGCRGRPGGAEAAAAPCPPMSCSAEVARVVLTASGGPFRTWPKAEVYGATPDQALKHPTWQMGPKVTVDSASLTNKALEVVEAHWLFGLPAEKIGVLVHPQSIVHALVEFADGSVLAQLGSPDMRSPIQYALTFPARPEGRARKLDFAALRALEFAPPDTDRFPALDAAYEIIRAGGTSGAVFNAANEAAVEAFLDRAIPFGRITELALGALRAMGASPLRSLADALEADAEARRWTRHALGLAPAR